MLVTNPTWLWAFIGLIIPIAIHLLSRKEGSVILIGSIRHLQESASARFRSIRLNEILLLLLRCLLLTLIILLLSGIALSLRDNNKKKWMLVEKGIEQSSEYQKLRDALSREGFESRFLAPNFPLVSDSAHVMPIDSYWALAEDLITEDIDSAVVISYSLEKYFKGERITEPNFRWISQTTPRDEQVMEAVQTPGDSIWIKRAFLTSEYSAFANDKKSSSALATEIKVLDPQTINITIIFDDEYEYDSKITLAAFKTIANLSPHRLIINTVQIEKYDGKESDWIIWLANQPPKNENTITKTIGLSSCAGDLPLIIERYQAKSICDATNGFDFVITQRLNEEIALEKNLVESLVDLVLPKSQSMSKCDRTMMTESAMWSKTKKLSPETKTTHSGQGLDSYITLLFFVTLAIERWLSFKKNQ